MSTATDETSAEPGLGNTLPTLDSQIVHTDQIAYWTSQTADVTGMLGGYPQVSRIDLQASKNFITKIGRLSRVTEKPSISGQSKQTAQNSASSSGKAAVKSDGGVGTKKMKLAVDCGAGIGRITSGLLVNIAEKVDIVEPVTKFTDVLRELSFKPDQGQIGQIFNQGLESWSPLPDREYDLIWVQWCLGHLTDKQAIDFLQRAAGALAGSVDGDEQGWMMVKENLSTDAWDQDIFDELDSSVTRSDQKFKHVFEEAGLKIVKMELQSGFPKSLYPVKMYALRPK